jgi:hypothetical protein
LIVKHFSAIQRALENYFPSIFISGVDWVTSPYGACSKRSVYNVASFASAERDQLMDIQVSADTTLKLKFYHLHLDSFFIYVGNEHPVIAN